jgi:hypothetical protein
LGLLLSHRALFHLSSSAGSVSVFVAAHKEVATKTEIDPFELSFIAPLGRKNTHPDSVVFNRCIVFAVMSFDPGNKGTYRIISS